MEYCLNELGIEATFVEAVDGKLVIFCITIYQCYLFHQFNEKLINFFFADYSTITK